MKPTDQTLLEQMRITEFDVTHRRDMFSFGQDCADTLLALRKAIEERVDGVVIEFYRLQTGFPEIALLIGDADTLARLRAALRRYILDLFSGVYDLEYVNNRLRIGLVHKRIGVDPTLYLSAVYTLRDLLSQVIEDILPTEQARKPALAALNKLLLFDTTLVFDTYIRSLIAETESAKKKAERYAQTMEAKVKERTQALEELSRSDALTGLLNVRHLNEIATALLRSSQRRLEPVTAIYIDINDFKLINDTQGHQRGDEVLKIVSEAIKSVTRSGDSSFRYGGDEFCILLPNCSEEQARDAFVSRLLAKVEANLPDVSMSIGIVQTGPNEYVDAPTLIRLADEGMYASKQALKSSAVKPSDLATTG